MRLEVEGDQLSDNSWHALGSAWDEAVCLSMLLPSVDLCSKGVWLQEDRFKWKGNQPPGYGSWITVSFSFSVYYFLIIIIIKLYRKYLRVLWEPECTDSKVCTWPSSPWEAPVADEKGLPYHVRIRFRKDKGAVGACSSPWYLSLWEVLLNKRTLGYS